MKSSRRCDRSRKESIERKAARIAVQHGRCQSCSTQRVWRGKKGAACSVVARDTGGSLAANRGTFLCSPARRGYYHFLIVPGRSANPKQLAVGKKSLFHSRSPCLKSAPVFWALIPQSATLYLYASAANPSFPAESKSIVSRVNGTITTTPCPIVGTGSISMFCVQ